MDRLLRLFCWMCGRSERGRHPPTHPFGYRSCTAPPGCAGRASSTGGVGPGVLVGRGIHASPRPARSGPGLTRPVELAHLSHVRTPASNRPHPTSPHRRAGAVTGRVRRAGGGTGGDLRGWDTIWVPRTGCAVSEVPRTCPRSRQSRPSILRAAQAFRDSGVWRLPAGCRGAATGPRAFSSHRIPVRPPTSTRQAGHHPHIEQKSRSFVRGSQEVPPPQAHSQVPRWAR